MPATTLTQLRVLSELAMPPAAGVPDALALVEKAIPSMGSMLLWSSPDGAVAGGYSTLVGMEAGLRHYAASFSNTDAEAACHGSRFREDMRRRTAAEVFSEIVGMPTSGFRQSEVYRDLLAPWGIDDGARVVVTHDGRPLGGLVVFRGPGDPPFQLGDLQTLDRLAPALGAVLMTRPSPDVPLINTDSPGIGVISAGGAIEDGDGQFRQLLAMLNQHAPGERATDFRVALPEGVSQWLDGRETVRTSVAGAWGEFRIECRPLLHDDRRVMSIQRFIPVGLWMFQATAGLQLSQRQLQAACGLAEGLSFNELARRWGIGRHSVVSHVNQTYLKLGVQTKSELMNRFVWPSPVGDVAETNGATAASR